MKRLVTGTRCARILFAALFLTAANGLFANNSKISPDLLPLLAHPTGTVNVIVQYSAPQKCPGLLGQILCPVVNLLGGVVNSTFTLLNAVGANVQTANIVALSNQSNVTYISLDRSLVAALDYTSQAVFAPQVWNLGWRGTGIGIAVIDSGIYLHPDLNVAGTNKSRVVYRQSFVPSVLNDDYGHGTHVAGILAGNGTSSQQPGSFRLLSGIAPNANLLDLRVLDENGAGTDSLVIAAIQQAVQLKNTYNVRVINLSIGRPIYESCAMDPLCQAVEAAWKAGIVVVVAAGNLGRNGYASITAPGNSPHAITVGCMKTEETYPRNDDLIASYSSKGPDLHRSDPEAGRSGSRQSGGVAPRSGFYAGGAVPAECDAAVLLHAVRHGPGDVFPTKRHQYVDSCGVRRSGVNDRAEPQP